MVRLLFTLFMFASVTLSQAEEVVLGMSHNEVAITATFDGSNILVFGAIKRDSPIPKTPLHVIVSISGPSTPVVVRRKEKRFGIWINKDVVEVDAAPSFYAIATTGPFAEVLSETEDLRHKVSINRAIRSVGAPMDVADAQSFSDALIRIRRDQGLYQSLEGTVALDQQTLFLTTIKMPANLTEGKYKTRIFLTREGTILNEFETSIDVRKVGLERFLFRLSRDNPLAYGLLSIAIAIFAGWLASAFFQVIRSR
jgi:uncharacterized protein (TIGR02186 family)